MKLLERMAVWQIKPYFLWQEKAADNRRLFLNRQAGISNFDREGNFI